MASSSMMSRETALGRAVPLVQKAESAGISLKLIGGIAIAASAKRGSQNFPRQYKDFDFFGLSSDRKKISQLFEEAGMKPDSMFNALHGATRMIYFDGEMQCGVDVLLDSFQMCHKVNLKDRVQKSRVAIPPSDMLLTKMQIVKITENDLGDTAALLSDFEIGACDSESELDGAYVSQVLANDWGFYKTFSINVQRLLSYLDGKPEGEVPSARIRALWEKVESTPKTLRWKMRERVGEKIKWYEEPEGVT
jgi:hypothetical protein